MSPEITSPLFLSAVIVDFVPKGGDFLRAGLSSFNIQSIDAADLNTAITEIRTRQPSFVFAHIDSLATDWPAFIRTVLQYSPETSIAIITTLSRKQVAIDCFQAGAADLLKKPVGANEVRTLLTRLVSVARRRNSRAFRPDDLLKADLQLTLASRSLVIPPAIASISSLLTGIASLSVRRRIELALDEMIRNAHEHGNLGINSEEKRRALEAGSYEQLLEERAADPRFIGRSIDVHAQIRAANGAVEFICQVTDEGQGFDWRTALAQPPNPEDLLDPSGRGLLLISQTFDEVHYNDLGNSVTATRRDW